MELLLNYTLEELYDKLSSFSLPRFKVDQIYKWLNKGNGFAEMSDVNKQLREQLFASYKDVGCIISQKQVSSDGTIKYLFQLNDGNFVEGVLMEYKHGKTLCVSTQVGCRMGCSFCASTLNGLVRNLTAGEILYQVIAVNKSIGGTLGEDREITNIVLMGCGEPLDNFDNVVKFFKLINCNKGLNFSLRNISLSTCGLVPQIKQLADLGLQCNLTVSLHSASQLDRERIMPIARQYSIEQLIEAARYYFDATKRRVIFEYTLIDGVNDSKEAAENLAKLVRGFPTHVNLIRLNEVKERGYKATTTTKAYVFLDYLTELNVSASLRRQMGEDIDGACGQLRNRTINNNSAGGN